MSLTGKLLEIAEGMPRVFDAGVAEGYSEGIDYGFDFGYEDGYSCGFENGHHEGYLKCAAKHYTEVKLGDGTNFFTVNCGFEPDLFMVFSTSSYPLSIPNAVSVVYNDFRSMGKYSAYRRQTDASAVQGNANITTSAATRFFSREGGNVGYDGSQSTSQTSRAYVFDKNTYYTAVCVKYTDKTDAEILADMVAALPSTGGSVDFSSIKVNGAFSEEEWQTLIATKPNWTFVLV